MENFTKSPLTTILGLIGGFMATIAAQGILPEPWGSIVGGIGGVLCTGLGITHSGRR